MSNGVPTHLKWLVNSGEAITLPSGNTVPIWDLQHHAVETVLSEWAKHFRNHYCVDHDLPALVNGTGLSNKDYLLTIKFPDSKAAPGPSIRAGDFAEILVADFVEYFLGYWCPRELRYDQKFSRDESAKGCDVLGFKFESNKLGHPNDELFIFESKAAFSGKPRNRLQDAVDDSIKDRFRESLSLNAIKQRFIERGDMPKATVIARFQNIVDRPFIRKNGAAAVVDVTTYDPILLGQTDINAHYNAAELHLLVIRGPDMMKLVHGLYERAANEA